MTQANANPNEEPKKEPTFEPAPITETQTEKSAFGNSSSEDTGLRLSEETEPAATQDSTTTATLSKPEAEPPPAEAVTSLKNLFSSVDDALKQSQGLIGDVQKLLGDLSWKPIEGSDTRALTDKGEGGSVSTFGGFSMGSTPDNEVTTKVYENGSVVTKFADGLELRFPPNGDFAEISINGEKPQRVLRNEANIVVATANGNGFKLAQKADGTLTIDFEQAQADGATSMTLFPANHPDGLKWTRNIPESDGIPAHTVSGRTDKTKRAEFAEPFGTVRSALSADNGEILVSSINAGGNSSVDKEPAKAESAAPVRATKSSASTDETTPAEKEMRQPTEIKPVFFPLEKLHEGVVFDGPLGRLLTPHEQAQLHALKGVSSPLVAMAVLAQLERIQNRQETAIKSGDLSGLKLDLPEFDSPHSQLGLRQSQLGLGHSQLGFGQKQDKPSFGTKEEQRLLQELQSANSVERATRILTRFTEQQQTGATGRISLDTAFGDHSLDTSRLANPMREREAYVNKMMMGALQEARTTEDFKSILGYITRFGTPGMPLEVKPSGGLLQVGSEQAGFNRIGAGLPGSGGRLVGGDMSPYLVNPSPLLPIADVDSIFRLNRNQVDLLLGATVVRPRAGDQGPPAFQPALTLVDTMSQSKDLRGAETALDALSDLAKKGDKHAQTALAATVLALEGGNAGLAQIYNMDLRDNPIFAPQLLNLSPEDRKTLRHRAMYELESQKGGDKPMSKEAMVILATTYEIAKSSGNTDNVEKLSKVLKESAGSDEGVSAFWRLHNLDKPQSDDLMKIFLEGMSENKHGQFYFESLGRRAGEGSKEDIRLLGLAVSSGEIKGEVSKTAMEGLQRAARDGQSDAVVSALKDVYAKHGDNSRLHETLGAIASDGKLGDKQYESIKKMLRDGVSSNDPELHNSAVQGLLRMPSKWTEADAKVLSEHMSPPIAEALKDAVGKLEPERGKQLAQFIQDKLTSTVAQNSFSAPVKGVDGYRSAEGVTSAVIALGALSDLAGPNAAKVIKDTATGTVYSGSDQLTRAGVASLMRMAGSMSPGSGSALELLKADGWKNVSGLPMERPEFRKELADFVTGDIARSEMSDEAKRIAYDTGFPQSIHRAFRDLGVGPKILHEMVDGARENYDDKTIRDVLSRAALYNALPEDMRARLFMGGEERTSTAATDGTAGSAPPINALQVVGQMANNKLKGSDNKVLLSPIENTVQKIENAFSQEQRRVAALVDLNRESTNKELQDLTKLTEKGVSTWRHFASLFGDSTLSDFTVEQTMRMGNYTALTDIGKMTSERLGKLTGIDQALSTSLNAHEYEQLKNSGNEFEADVLAVQMLQRHGPALSQRAPEVWKDLGMSVEQPSSKETVFQRLHRQGLAQSPDTPQIQFGTHEGMKMGIALLSNNLDERKLDAQARTTLGLLAVDTDPALNKFSETVRDLQGRFPALQELVTAGVNGTRTEAYVGGVQKLVKEFQTVYDSMNKVDPKTGLTPAQEAKQSLELLKQGLPNLDPDVREQVNERIKAMEKMLEFLDPNSQSGKDMRLMFDQVNSTDFDESNFKNWLKSDGLKTLAAIAVGVGAAVALATLGPFVVAAAGVAGGIIGYEGMSELLFQARQFGIVDTGERVGSRIGQGARGGLNMGKDGHAETATVSGALEQYGWEFLQGTAIALATMGAGNILGRTIAGLRGSASAGMNANASGLGRLAARVQQVEHAAEKVGGKALMQKWMTAFNHEFREEIVEEALGKGAEAGMQEILGDVNPVMSVMASAVIANRKGGGGFDVHAQRHGEVHIEIQKGFDADVTMSKLHQQLQADGMRVEWNGKAGTPMKVTTPEGEVLTLHAREAGASVDTAHDTRVRDAAGSDASLERVGLEAPGVDAPKLEAPGVDTPKLDTPASLKPRRADSPGSESDPATNTPAQRQQHVEGLVKQLKQLEPGSPQKAQLEAQIKETIVDQAKDYARKLGLVVKDADGNITDYLINPEQISLVRGKENSSFSWDNKMEINIDDPELMSTLLHEMRHQKDYYGLTVQKLASEISGDHRFEHRLQEEVFGELKTGDTRVVTSDGEYRGFSQGLERQIPEIRKMLREFHAEVKGQTFDRNQALEFLQKNYPDAKATFLTQTELAQIMVQSVADYQPAGKPIDEPRRELIEHPELRKPLSNMLKEFAGDRPNGQATPAEIESFLASADLSSFKNAGMTNADVAKLMSKELEHYQHVLALSSMTPAGSDGPYTDRLKQALEASGNPKLFNELMRRAQSTAASGSNVELQHLTRGLVETRLGIAQLPAEYFGNSPFERAAYMIEATQKLSSIIDQGGKELDSTMDRVKFESRALQFTRAFSEFRTETDPVKQAELWEKSQVAAKKYAESLPDHEVGQEMAERLLKHGLIEEIPPQFKGKIDANDFEQINDSTAMARLSPHANSGASIKPPAGTDNASSSSPDTQARSHADSRPAVQTFAMDDVVTFQNKTGQTLTGEYGLDVFEGPRKTDKGLVFLEGGTMPPPDTVPDPKTLTPISRDAKQTTNSVTKFSYDADGRIYEYKDGKHVFRNDMALVNQNQISNISRDGTDYTFRPISALENSVKDSVSTFNELQNKAGSMSVEDFRSRLLDLMSQAPEVSYSMEQLGSFNSRQENFLTSFNNPTDAGDLKRANQNCMDCVAALYHSLHDGRIMSVSDVKHIKGPNGKPVGINEPQLAESLYDAEQVQVEWLTKAAGINPPSAMNSEKVSAYAEKTGVKDFAVVVTKSKFDSAGGHVFYGRVQPDGSMMYYDPQSGVRWSPQSVEASNPSFYPLTPRTGSK